MAKLLNTEPSKSLAMMAGDSEDICSASELNMPEAKEANILFDFLLALGQGSELVEEVGNPQLMGSRMSLLPPACKYTATGRRALAGCLTLTSLKTYRLPSIPPLLQSSCLYVPLTSQQNRLKTIMCGKRRPVPVAHFLPYICIMDPYITSPGVWHRCVACNDREKNIKIGKDWHSTLPRLPSALVCFV
eukprot:695500-Pelagomonas_calceolata.AAC.1